MLKRVCYTFFLSLGLTYFLAGAVLETPPANDFFISTIDSINTAYAQPQNAKESLEDAEKCKERLNGSTSKAACLVACTAPGYVCALARKYEAEDDPELDEDLECYGCRRLTCRDYGRLDAAGKAACDARPGWISTPAPPTPTGQPCWSCVKQKDECNKKWPGSSWLPACQAKCKGKGDKCVQVGVHQGRACYKCQKKVPPPKTCKDINPGYITKAQCNQACQDPTPVCKWTGDVDAKGNLCYTCAPKKKKKDGDDEPPPDLTCEEINPRAQTPPCDCGKGYPVSVQLRGKDCCVCLEDECSPDLNVWDCIDCEKRGGMCYALTRTRNGPQCYGCRMPPKQPKTCEEAGRYSSCSPFPCKPREERCIPDTASPAGLDCFRCVPRHQPPPPDYCSPEYHPNCSHCYARQLACTSVEKTLASGRKIECYECEDPYRMKRCADYNLDDGGCAPNPCADRGDGKTQCRELQGNNFTCHICEEPPKYIECPDGYFVGQCSGNYPCDIYQECENHPTEQCYTCKEDEEEIYCEDFGYNKKPCPDGYECEKINPDLVGGLRDCCLCKKKPEPPPECDDGLKDGPCLGDSCPLGFYCNPVGKDCHECLPKSCEEMGFAPINGCPQGHECLPVSTPAGVECCDCYAIDCAHYDLSNKAACEAECAGDETRECKPTATAPSGEQCYQCLTKDKYICDPEKGEYVSGSNCGGQCNEETQWCVPIPGHDYGCEYCKDKPPPKGCQELDLPTECPEDQKCAKTVTAPNGEQCCEECAPKNCRDLRLMNSRACSDRCDDDDEVCAYETRAPSGEYCYKCYDRDEGEEPPPPHPCQYDLNLHPEACMSSQCKDGSPCHTVMVEGKECHYCGEEDPRQPCYQQNRGRCPADCNPQTQICREIRDQGEFCHRCVQKSCSDLHMAYTCSELECPDGYQCRPVEVNEGQFCADCFEIGTVHRACEDVGGVVSCDICDRRTETCDRNNPIMLGDLECYKCIPKNKSSCESYSTYGQSVYDSCDPNPCRDGYNCIPFSPASGVECARCEWVGKEDQQCPDEFPVPGACPGLCHVGQVCVDNGQCHQCRDYDDVREECSDGYYPRKCASDFDCSYDEYCDPDPNNPLCSACVKKPRTCEDVGLKTKCEGDEKCVPASHPRLDVECCNCVKKSCEDYEQFSTTPECNDGYHPEPSGFSAPDGTQCWRCAPNSCEEDGFAPPGGCPPGQECAPVSTLAGKECCECYEPPPPEKDPCEEHGYRSGFCPGGTCSEDEICIPKTVGDNLCHICEPKDCSEIGKVSDFNCDCGEFEKCVPDGKAPNGEACMKCVPMDPEEKCSKRELQSGDCPGTCSEDEVCVSENVGGAACHRCREKNIRDICAQEQLNPGDCPGMCSPSERCHPAKVGNTQCHSCTPDPCYSNNLFPGACSPNACSIEGEKCVEKIISGETCHICEKMTVQDICMSAELNAGDCPGNCSGGEICIPRTVKGEQCHICGPKEEDPCAKRELQSGDCPGTCSATQQCIPLSVDGAKCHSCQDIETDQQCEDGFTPGRCIPISCSENQSCVEIAGPCHSCVEKQPSCYDFGYGEGSCPGRCEDGEVCENVTADGMKCYRCKKKTEEEPRDNCARRELNSGGCPGSCLPPGEECVESTVDGQKCHRCDRDPCYYSQAESGGCPGTCSEDTECKSFTIEGKTCHQCWTKPVEKEPDCDQYSSPGGCDGHACASGERCFETPGPCHECRKWTCDEPLISADDCQACRFSGGKCWPIYTLAQSIGNAPLCYECRYPESCEKYGLVSMCGMCPPGTACVQKRTLSDPQFGEIPCYDCLPVKVSVDLIYIPIINETIVIIQIQDKMNVDPSSALNNFVPKKVLGLAKAAQGGGNIQSVAGLLPGAGNAFSFLQGGVSLENLAGTLKEGLESSRGYTETCFDDFEEPEVKEPEPDTRIPEKERRKRRKAKTQQTEEADFGKDLDKYVTTGGPVVVCGENDKEEKVLAILDASGRPVEALTRQMLEDNPNAVTDALLKAEQMSQQLLSARQSGIQGMVNRASSYLSQKINQTLSRKPAHDVEENAPNDPLYLEEKKKKKGKFLGIFGSSKKAAPVTIGSGIRVGGRTLGGGAREEKEQMNEQWGLVKIGFTPYSDEDSAWNAAKPFEKNVVVAVIDSGLDFDHPDGPEYIWKNGDEIPGNGIDDDKNGYIDDIHGWNFLNENHDFTDYAGHGTFVSGIIAAKQNNGIGIAGINPGAVIMPLKITDDEGEGTSLNLYRAIHYAVDNGAQIINISMGGPGDSRLIQAALNYADAMGVFVVVSSTNFGRYTDEVVPTKAFHAFPVGSIDIEGNRSVISAWGPNNKLMAPGDTIMSLCSKDNKNVKPSIRKKGYYTLTGTSFSAPMVTGTASLILANNPNLTNTQLADILMRSAEDMDEEGWDDKTGAGVLDARAALRENVNDEPTYLINKIRLNHDSRDEVESVDVFATVRGPFKHYTIGIGKGSRARRFETVAGPFDAQADNDWVVRVDEDDLRGSDEWIFQVEVTLKDGSTKTAQTLVNIEED